jgi:hypothetical protein
MKVSDILEANYWKADKTYRQKRLPTLEPDPVDNAIPFDASTHDQPDDHSTEIDLNNAQVRAEITQLLLKLPPRMERMLRERFFQGLTLEQISLKYGISRESIRQIESRALRILKHPSRAKRLRSMLQTSTTEGLRDPKDNPCWKGYHPVGTKKKRGRTVPNCVPEAANAAQQAAIAIAKKKKKKMDEGKYPGRGL